MPTVYYLSLRQSFIATGASILLLSSAPPYAGNVSPPPRPMAVRQIAMPGENPEQLKQNARAHGNKLKNKVKIDRDETASLDEAGAAHAAGPTSSLLMSLSETQLRTYAVAVKIGQ